MPLLILMGPFVMLVDTPQPLFDFTGADGAKDWKAVNDGVMGGVSEGKFTITDRKTLEFFGTLSLANSGGFASVRTKAGRLDRSFHEVARCDQIVTKLNPTARDAGDFQQLVNDPCQLPHLALDDGAGFVLELVLVLLETEQLDGVGNGGQGVAEFVAEHRQKFILATMQFGQLVGVAVQIVLQPLPLRLVPHDFGEAD